MADGPKVPTAQPAKTPAAQRALDEAAHRRRAAPPREPLPREVAGRDGPEPIRFGDWEKKGIATDF